VLGIFKKKLCNFRQQTGGNVAMMFAIVLTVIMAGLALAIDGSRLLSLRSNLQDITDAASLAGAYAANEDAENREDIVREAIGFHLASIGSDVNIEDITIVFDDTTQELTVGIESDLDLILGGLISGNAGGVQAQSVASYSTDEVRPASISLVLDVSGSMTKATSGGQTRLETLKQASVELFNAIKEASPRPDRAADQVRSGMTVFAVDLKPEHTVQMNKGWQHVLDEVQTLSAKGDTNSTPSFQASFDLLQFDPVQPDGVRKFMIFMTDGNNDFPESNPETIALCDQAKLSNIRVFAVAFEAPAKGQALLEACASEPKAEHFFDASNGIQFRQAFEQIGAEIGEANTRLVR